MTQYNVTELRSLLEEYRKIDTRPDGVFTAFASRNQGVEAFLEWLEQRGAGGEPEDKEDKEEKYEYPPNPDYDVCYRVKFSGWRSSLRMKREQSAFLPIAAFDGVVPTLAQAEKQLHEHLGDHETDVIAVDGRYYYTATGHRLPDNYDPQNLTEKQKLARKATENLENLQRLKQEQICLLEEVAITLRIQYWTGIRYDEIKQWGFGWQYMRNEFKKKYSRLHAENELTRTHINFIRTKDGKDIPIPLMRRPEPLKRKG